MPELPEVTTTVNGLTRVLPGQVILDIWSDLANQEASQMRPTDVNTFKNKSFFVKTKKILIGAKVKQIRRRGKNILIDFDNDWTVLTHMKMTGHFLYGHYEYNKKSNTWQPTEKGPLQDPYNRFVHVMFTLSGDKQLAFCDVRKFGVLTLIPTKELNLNSRLSHLGPEPLDSDFTATKFQKVLLQKPRGKIKQALMNQEILVGVGNIYSDEILWQTGIHPETLVDNLLPADFKNMFSTMQKLLKKGIQFGGDSTSDYRDIDGSPGKFQGQHHAYRRTGQVCDKKDCDGVIIRKMIAGRSSHFCSVHQLLKIIK